MARLRSARLGVQVLLALTFHNGKFKLLSMVESHSSSSAPDPVQSARDALAAAHDAQQQVGREMRYDALDESLYATATGLTVLATGLGGAIELHDDLWLRILVPVIYLTALALLGYGIARFKAKNGVWVSGFSPRRSRWVARAVVVLVGGLTLAAAYAGNEGLWALVAVTSLAGAAGAFALSRLWMRVYRGETSAGPRG